MFQHIRLVIAHVLERPHRRRRVLVLRCGCGAKIEARDPMQLFAAARSEGWSPGVETYVCRGCAQ